MTACAKVRYRDRVAALVALARIQAIDGGHGEQRPYWCLHCKGWHLTKQPRRGRVR